VHFGEHITIDGYDGNPAKLNDEGLIRSSLTELCALLGMRPLAEPVVARAPDNRLKDPGGWSGFLLIAESHLAIHTFPRRRFLSADAYTCKNNMDCSAVVDFFRSRFELGDIEQHFIRRGLRYPPHNIA
jgi:S-adenosylmethionine decarboxylase